MLNTYPVGGGIEGWRENSEIELQQTFKETIMPICTLSQNRGVNASRLLFIRPALLAYQNQVRTLREKEKAAQHQEDRHENPSRGTISSNPATHKRGLCNDQVGVIEET